MKMDLLFLKIMLRQFVDVIVNFYNNKDLLNRIKKIVSILLKNMIGKKSQLNIY